MVTEPLDDDIQSRNSMISQSLKGKMRPDKNDLTRDDTIVNKSTMNSKSSLCYLKR